jgi:serine/threonine-protein kinase RsbW
MPGDLDVSVPATTSGLKAALQSLEGFCAVRHVHEDLLSRCRIVVEELFTNTIKYGYGGECDRPVRVSVSTSDGLAVTLEDEAGTFDPTLWKPENDQAERVGQAGIALVLGLSSRVVYEEVPGGNRITVVFR